MKKALLLLIIVANTMLLHSQSRLGYTANDIRNELYYRTFTSGLSNDGTPYITYSTDDYDMVYYFNTEGRCYLCFMVVKRQGFLNAKIEQFNKEAVIISNTEWKLYHMNGAITNIQLLYYDGYNIFVFN